MLFTNLVMEWSCNSLMSNRALKFSFVIIHITLTYLTLSIKFHIPSVVSRIMSVSPSAIFPVKTFFLIGDLLGMMTGYDVITVLQQKYMNLLSWSLMNHYIHNYFQVDRVVQTSIKYLKTCVSNAKRSQNFFCSTINMLQ